jgi:NADP-dependent 3-hydroxy acid dehydrogenase YdfG
LDATTAVVTGASSGIGAATARALAAEGAAVALLARRGDRLETLATEIAALPDSAGVRVYQLDVSDAEAVHETVEQVVRDLGGIDVLVNNAGYGAWSPALKADFGEWRKMVEVNLNGVLATTHAALPHLTAAAQGPRGIADIVTVSSVAGRKIPYPSSNVYSATKHAVGAFAEALRQELAEHHIRVGLVEPGIVVTEMSTSKRDYGPDATSASELGAIEAHDVADAVVYMVARPRRVAINEMLMRPTEQIL